MNWLPRQSIYRFLMKPATGPVMLGAIAGALMVMTIADFSSNEPEAVVAAASQPEPRIIVPARPTDSSVRSGRLLDPFLEPRPEAIDLTRRIVNGLPLVDPEPPPMPRRTVAPAPRQDLTARSKTGVAALPAIAVVIDDMGFDRTNSDRALRLPPAVTLAYLPDAPSVASQVRAARARGHQVMLHLPMEADEHGDRPGQDVLSVHTDLATMQQNLVRMLRSFPGYIGVNNHQGSRFTRDPARMSVVLAELKRRGLFFLDSRTSGGSVGERIALDAGISYAVRDIFLDHDPDSSKIRERMTETERLARATGQAIAIGHPRTLTMDLIGPWLSAIEERGFRLVPVSELLKRSDRPASGKELARNAYTE